MTSKTVTVKFELVKEINTFLYKSGFFIILSGLVFSVL